MDTMLQIGGFDPQSVSAMADTVIQVSNCSDNEDVVIKALDTLARLAEATPAPTHTSINGSSFINHEPKPVTRRRAAPKKTPAR